MKDQDERHELLGRLETPPEFKDWASNTLPTPGISNGHQTMAEGRGTSEHERLSDFHIPWSRAVVYYNITNIYIYEPSTLGDWGR